MGPGCRVISSLSGSSCVWCIFSKTPGDCHCCVLVAHLMFISLLSTDPHLPTPLFLSGQFASDSIDDIYFLPFFANESALYTVFSHILGEEELLSFYLNTIIPDLILHPSSNQHRFLSVFNLSSGFFLPTPPPTI